MESDRINPQNGRKRSQILPAFIATLGAFGCGTVLSWPVASLSHLDESICKDDCDIKLTKDQSSLLAAIMNIGAMCVGPVAAVCMKQFGKKWTMIQLSVPFAIGWILLGSSTGPGTLYAGRILTGFAGGAFGLVAPAYTSEISESSIKGALGSLQQLMVTLAILMVDVLAKYVSSWRTITWICFSIPILLGVFMIFMPQSPFFLITKGREDDARKSLERLRGPKYNCEMELKAIKEAVEESKRIGTVSFGALFTKRVYRTPLLLSLVLMFLQQFTGINAVVSYTTTIFRAANTSLDDDTSTVLVALTQVVGTAIAVAVVDRFGRKLLLILSDSLMCIFLGLLAIYFTLLHNQKDVDSISWLPLVSVMGFIFGFSIGFGPLPWVLNSELFPKEAKVPAASLCASFNWLCSFLVVKFEPDLEELFGNYGAFFIFSAICGLGAIFIFFFVPETKGKTEEEMREYFLGSNQTVDSGRGIENPGYNQEIL